MFLQLGFNYNITKHLYVDIRTETLTIDVHSNSHVWKKHFKSVYRKKLHVSKFISLFGCLFGCMSDHNS